MYKDDVRVVGMGTQDDLGLAEDFLDRHNPDSVLMTWDESFATWDYYEVRGQPTTILVDPSGRPLGQWVGLDNEIVSILDSQF